MGEIYGTSFCNFGHDMTTGRPIDHECHILPPAMLRAERAGDIDRANDILHEEGAGPIVLGRARRAP